jgi:hypothetical protein
VCRETLREEPRPEAERQLQEETTVTAPFAPVLQVLEPIPEEGPACAETPVSPNVEVTKWVFSPKLKETNKEISLYEAKFSSFCSQNYLINQSNIGLNNTSGVGIQESHFLCATFLGLFPNIPPNQPISSPN